MGEWGVRWKIRYMVKTVALRTTFTNTTLKFVDCSNSVTVDGTWQEYQPDLPVGIGK